VSFSLCCHPDVVVCSCREHVKYFNLKPVTFCPGVNSTRCAKRGEMGLGLCWYIKYLLKNQLLHIVLNDSFILAFSFLWQ